jgi:hypothetical protein
MDFANHVRELFRQALAGVIQDHIPEHLRIPFALGLILIGTRCTLDPLYAFRKAFWAQPREPREDRVLVMRCVGVLLLIAAGVLLEFR